MEMASFITNCYYSTYNGTVVIVYIGSHIAQSKATIIADWPHCGGSDSIVGFSKFLGIYQILISGAAFFCCYQICFRYERNDHCL